MNTKSKDCCGRWDSPCRGEDFSGLPRQFPTGSIFTYPLVAKISSSKVISKSNVGGVRTDIQDAGELNRAFRELSRIESAEGVLVEEMAPRGVEVIIGGINDDQFGSVVMFGLGGIFVELFKDVAFGLAPLSAEDALGSLRRSKGTGSWTATGGSPPLINRDLQA